MNHRYGYLQTKKRISANNFCEFLILITLPNMHFGAAVEAVWTVSTVSTVAGQSLIFCAY